MHRIITTMGEFMDFIPWLYCLNTVQEKRQIVNAVYQRKSVKSLINQLSYNVSRESCLLSSVAIITFLVYN